MAFRSEPEGGASQRGDVGREPEGGASQRVGPAWPLEVRGCHGPILSPWPPLDLVLETMGVAWAAKPR